MLHGAPHVTAEAGHLNAVGLCDGLDHEVRAVADVGDGSAQDGAQRDGHEVKLGNPGNVGAAGVGDLAGHLEEGRVGGGVVQDGGEPAGEDEEGDLVERQRAGHLVEVVQGRDHGEEDADEQDGDLGDGPPGELVVLEADLAAAQEVGAGRGGEHDELAHGDPVAQGGVPLLDGVSVDGGGEGDGGDDDGEEDEVERALEAQGLDLGVVVVHGLGGLLGVVVGVQGVVAHQQHDVDEEVLAQEVEGPGEGHPAQESQEQGRVAQGREEAAAVGHDEDRVQHRVHPVVALLVGGQQGPDEEHGGAGGAHEGGDDSADGQEDRVVAGRGPDVALEEDASGDDEQGQQQADELDVLHHGGEDGRPAQGDPHPGGHRNPQAHGDDQLAGVLLPPVGRGRDQRQDGDAGEHAREGQDGPPLKMHGNFLTESGLFASPYRPGHQFPR